MEMPKNGILTIAPKYGCVVAEWTLGFNKKIFQISFWALGGAVGLF